GKGKQGTGRFESRDDNHVGDQLVQNTQRGVRSCSTEQAGFADDPLWRTTR
ncbi:unnamed protein product, partial [Litomosoides sigmodontis]